MRQHLRLSPSPKPHQWLPRQRRWRALPLQRQPWLRLQKRAFLAGSKVCWVVQTRQRQSQTARRKKTTAATLVPTDVVMADQMAAQTVVPTDAVNALTGVVSAEAVMAAVVAVAAVMAALNGVASVANNVLQTGLVQKVDRRAAAMIAGVMNAANAVLKVLAPSVRNARPVSNAMMRRGPIRNQAANRVSPASHVNPGQRARALSAHAASAVSVLREMTVLTAHCATRQSKTSHLPTRPPWPQP